MSYLTRKEHLKIYLKKYRSLQSINALVKSFQAKRQYQSLCERYSTPSILREPDDIANLGKILWKRYHVKKSTTSWRPRILFVGTDCEQDHSGIIQGLSKIADVTLFINSQGDYGQLWPKSLLEVEHFRRCNGQRLLKYIRESKNQKPYDIIVGQMWGLSIHWSALSEAREKGIMVVNISMDDRHAFIGRKLQDQSWSGTRGILPYLSLACTDAPECVQWYERQGCKAIYFPEASDPELFYPFPGPKLYDVSFVGANYGIRAKIVQALRRAGIQVKTFGNGWPDGRIPTKDVPQLFAQSKIVLGCGTVRTSRDFYALKLRDFDAPMSGSLYMTHANPDLHALFEIGNDIITYEKIDDMIKKVKSIMNNNSFDNDRYSQSARLHCLEFHTWERRFKTLLNILSQLNIHTDPLTVSSF